MAAMTLITNNTGRRREQKSAILLLIALASSAVVASTSASGDGGRNGALCRRKLIPSFRLRDRRCKEKFGEVRTIFTFRKPTIETARQIFWPGGGAGREVRFNHGKQSHFR